jgi:hypothetical protein
MNHFSFRIDSFIYMTEEIERKKEREKMHRNILGRYRKREDDIITTHE